MKKIFFIILLSYSCLMLRAQSGLLSFAQMYAEKGDYEKAIKYANKALASNKEMYGEKCKKYAEALFFLAYYTSETGNYTDAILIGTKGMEIRKEILGNKSSEYAASISDLALYNSYLGNYEEAIRLGTEALNIHRENYGVNNPDYAASLTNLAMYNFYIANYEEAIRIGTEAMNIQRKNFGQDNPDYARSLLNLAKYYDCIANYQEATRLGTESIEIQRKIHGDKHPDYALALSFVATIYQNSENYEEAFRLGKEASSIQKEILGEKHPAYAESLSFIAGIKRDLCQYLDAIQLYTEAMSIRKEVLGMVHPDYASSLKELANSYYDIGDYHHAILLGTEAMTIEKNVLGEKHPDYASSLNNLASYYCYQGDYKKAVEFSKIAMNIAKDTYGENHPIYATMLNNIAIIYGKLGNWQEAIKITSEAINVQRKAIGNKDSNYARFMGNLSGYYHNIGNIQEAINLSREAMTILKETLGERHLSYAISLRKFANYNFENKEYDKSYNLFKEALNIIKEIVGEKHPMYAIVMNDLAGVSIRLKNFQESIQLASKSADIKKDIFGEKHHEYAYSLYTLGICNCYLGNYNDAILQYTQAMNILKNVFGTNHEEYATALYRLADLYIYIGDIDEGTKYTKEAFLLGKQILLNNFATMTPFEMKNFLYKQRYITDECIAKNTAYDALLLNKGILLNAELAINELIQESGDTTALKISDHIKRNTLILNKQLEKPISERYLDVDSLSTEIEKERKQLSMQSKEFGDFTKYFSTTWQDVRDNLKKNEAAIEFGTLPKGDIDVSDHCTRALILRHNSKEPEEVYLELDSAKSFKENIIANWPTIQDYLKGIERVYFSPSGELYSTPIENYINDGREYIRVSSTREVVLRNQDKPVLDKPIKLYGGLRYDLNIDDLAEVNEEYNQTKDDETDFLIVRSSRDAVKRASFGYLKGTLDEVQSICSIADSNNKQCDILTGESGTEESLCTINGKRYGVLHFATHGFYWTEEEAEDKVSERRLSFLMMDKDNRPRYAEDKAMTRSGLIFSGANLALRGQELPEGMEDGVATAQEISHLDLRGCDLVVLSACQTGLGEVSGEGVFGLQRGFKKAGVNSILMSLWEVDDHATQMLMINFYKHYLKGESKMESLRKAQQFVKSQPGFEAPEYWAGFILLDGLN